MLRGLALDFDGVISNSAPEAFVVALRTFLEVRTESLLGNIVGGVAGGIVPTLKDVQDHPLFGPFVDAMPLGNRAEDYAVVLTGLESGRAIPNQVAYDEYRGGFDLSWLRNYHARFYRIRAELVAADPEGWQGLMSPYPSFVQLLRRRAPTVGLSVATAKDRGSVRKLLRAYGIDDLFPEGFVLDKEKGATKSAHLEHLRRKFGCRFEEMTFIDDKVSHLDEVGRLGVRCALAGWGFNGERESELAKAAGHLVCTLDDVEAQVFE